MTGPLGRDPTGLRALDIGCGGGFLAEEFARLGCRVVGVDPSKISIETAGRHAAGAGLDVTYLVGAGEQLPVADSSFDIAYCCDVLEHVSDLDSVIAETARALKPRGVYFFAYIQSYGQMSRILKLGPTKRTSMSYMGYATKAGDSF